MNPPAISDMYAPRLMARSRFPRLGISRPTSTALFLRASLGAPAAVRLEKTLTPDYEPPTISAWNRV